VGHPVWVEDEDFDLDLEHVALIGGSGLGPIGRQVEVCRALEALFTVLFGALGKHRVFGSIDPRNARSIALVERAGMRREAHHRESLWFKGEWADDVVYALLRREWLARARR